MSNAEISKRVNVSASTVGKRIKYLEERGVITGYSLDVDHEKMGYPLRILFVCTSPIAERERIIKQIQNIDGINSILEMMTGEANIHVEVLGFSNDDITRIAEAIDELGVSINDEILIRDEYNPPLRRVNSKREME